MKNVLKKLQEARMRLIATTIKKGARNEFAKYNYMELADFLIPAQKIFSEIGLVGVVSFTPELATLTITDLESGESTLVTSPMSTADLRGCHAVQNLGAVQTYLRRYLWVAALEIVEHDAIDSSAPTTETEAKRLEAEGKEAAQKGQDALRDFYRANHKTEAWAEFWHEHGASLQKKAKEVKAAA